MELAAAASTHPLTFEPLIEASQPFFLRSAQRRFIASDRRFLPAAVSRPRFLPVVAGEDAAILAGPRLGADPDNASIARPIRSLSDFKSAIIFSTSNVLSFRST
jgi:hypothetical protein